MAWMNGRVLVATAAAFVACGGEQGDPGVLAPDGGGEAGGDGGADVIVKPPPAQSDPGTIVYLDVVGEDGEPLAEYYAGHPVRVTVRIRPAEGFAGSLGSLENMHVGLVSKLAPDADRETARTCYLGQVEEARVGVTVTEDGLYEFVSERYLPEDCLEEDEDGHTFNVWVALDPARDVSFEEGEGVADEDYNTQFFNDRFEDMDGRDRNRQCRGRDGQEGCILDLAVRPSPGHNLELREARTESSVFVVHPDHCAADLDELGRALHLQTTVRLHGSDAHDGMTGGEVFHNPLEHLLDDGEAVEIEAMVCPRADDGSCLSAFRPLARTHHGEDGTVALAGSFAHTELVVGRDHVAHHGLTVDPAHDLCDLLTGADGAAEDWSGYALFTLRVCARAPFAEAGHGGDVADDNCRDTTLRKVAPAAADDGEGGASSLAYSQAWSASPGNDVVRLDASFGTDNHVDLSGAYAHAWADTSLGGWMSIPLVDVDFEARAYVSLVGSGVSAHIDTFGLRLWSLDQGLDEKYTYQERLEYARSVCVDYNYGIAGIGLNASLCATGTAYLDLAGLIEARDGADTPPFDASTRIGYVEGTVTPGASFDLTATASLNLVAARGGVTGTLTLLRVELPATANLAWGLVDGPSLVVVSSANCSLDTTLLSGVVSVWVDLMRPAWCRCGRWCPGYPCNKWNHVVNQPLVSFSGFRTTTTLLDVPATTVTLF